MKATRRTAPRHEGACERCAAHFGGVNALALAARHAEQTTHRVNVERTIVYTWDPLAMPAGSPIALELATQQTLGDAISFSNGHAGAV